MFILTACSAVLYAQPTQLLEERNSASVNLEVFKGTIGDSSINVMKELVQKQNELIEADRNIIEVYLDSVQTRADSLKRANINLTADKEMAEKALMINKDLLYYSVIGGGVVFILFILFMVLFFIATGKKKKLKKQITDIDKIKQAYQKEIENTKKEVESMKASAHKEIMNAKADLNKEAGEMLTKIDSLTAEKLSLEKKAGDKAFEFSQMQLRLNSIKEDYEKKLSAVKAESTDFVKEKLQLEKQIFENGIEVDKLKKERENALKDSSEQKDALDKALNEKNMLEAKMNENDNEYQSKLSKILEETDALKKDNDRLLNEVKDIIELRELCEKYSSENKELNARLQEKENEVQNITPLDNDELFRFKSENEILKNEISGLYKFKELFEQEENNKKQIEQRLEEKENTLNGITPMDTKLVEDLRRDNELLRTDIENLQKQIDKEIQSRNLIEDELRKFIDELKDLK